MHSRDGGFTLVEMIVTVAILAIVIISAYSIFHFEKNTYTAGIAKTNLQSSLRLAADIIVRELRFAENVSFIIDSEQVPLVPDEVPDSNYYLYWDQVNQKIVLLNNAEEKIISSVPITFFSVDADGRLVSINMTGSQGSFTYDVDTSVLLLNADEPASSAGSILAICYQK